MPDTLIIWSIRLCLACYVAILATHAVGRAVRHVDSFARWLWTLGFVALAIHFITVFHFHMGWSHAAAVQHTADETQRKIGMAVGWGVYFNYGFLIAWGVLLIRAWRHPVSNGRNLYWQKLDWCLHAYLAFIAFQSTVVFERGVVQWTGIAATLILIALACAKSFWIARKPR